MEQSKYYTPSIEEFYVGFEYYKYYGDELLKEPTFPEGAGDHAIDNIRWELDKENRIKVKYLDQEDIESLGWKYTGKKDDYGFLLFTKKIEIGFNSGNLLTLRYSPVNHGIWVKRQTYGSWGDYVDEFPFYVKNKSELKKLMQQLNIE